MDKILGILAVSFFAALAGQSQPSAQIEAELRYRLYGQIVARSAGISSDEDRSALAESYYFLGNTDSAVLSAYSSLPQPRSILCLARCYAQKRIADSACLYLGQYLAQPDKLPRAEIVMDTALARIEKEQCWKQLWRQDWYPQPTAEDEYALMLAAGKYSQLLDELQSSGAKENKYLYYRAGALVGLGQDRDALKTLDAARSVQELALKWQLEDQLGKHKAALQTAKRYLARCNSCYEGLKMAGVSAYRSKDPTLSQQYLDEYLSAYYMDADALYVRALIQTDNARYLDALETTNTAMRYSPAHAPTLLLRGDIFSEINNWEHAAKMYQQYLDAKANSAEVYYKLGNALYRAGNKQQSCREMEFAKHFGSQPAVEFYRTRCLK